MSERSRIVLSVSALAILAMGCQSAHPPSAETSPAEIAARPAVDALDRNTALSRDQRVSNLSYAAIIDIASNTNEFSGDVLIKFELSSESDDLTLDFTGGSLERVSINDTILSPAYNGYFITLPASALRSGPNTIAISYRRPYGHDGTGLHRFVDPEDGRTYMHSYLWPYYANRVIPSFDQPSLKAEFELSVIAPKDWEVISTTPGSANRVCNDARQRCEETQLWTFPKTPRISTYFFSIHAGPYKIWEDDSGAVPLRLMARRSLAKYVAADEWLEITRNGMTYFEDYFDIPYPFAKYDQLIVPEFNIGGMENAAAVTYSERHVQRQPSKLAQRESRAGTILHELAHMWFGDLVTHDWWNGMWLNESFATQMESLALAETTDFGDQWHGFFTESKTRAYALDSRVTTHPVEMPVVSTAQFSELFDAITYQKGGSVLHQLRYRVGPENYRRGISAYLKKHAWGTTTLADFISAHSEASGTDLSDWSEEWLTKPGFNTLAATARCENGIVEAVAIAQTAPAEWPYLRSHHAKLALYEFDDEDRLVVTNAIPYNIDGAATEITTPGSWPCPALVNPNFEDRAYAKIDISDAHERLLADQISAIADPLSRSMFLQSLYDKAMSGDMPIADYVRLSLRLSETEQNARVLQQLTVTLTASIQMLQRLRPRDDRVLHRLLDDVEELGLKRADFARTDDLKRLWFGLFLDVASSDAALGTSRALLDGRTEVTGLDMSPDLRWRLVTILSKGNAPGSADLMRTEIEQDPSDLGQRSLLSARAAVPDLANKEHWVDELQFPVEINNLSKQRAIMSTLFPATQTELQLALLTKLLRSLPQMSRDRDTYFLSSYTSNMFTPMCLKESSDLMQATLDEYRDELHPTVLKYLREAHQADVECQALQAVQ